ncbi:S26 family signal peptidase [Promicromonospora sp. NPDC060271]|uniref:S26 family signal peptidase n=1 Tax=Promicromonospora sp. NPDC060271 TaxID=3347089 RepID=UPI0036534644
MTGTAVVFALALAGAVLAGSAGYRHLRHHYVVVAVDGMSMHPTYEPGDRVLVRRGGRAPARGDVVVVRKPDVKHGWPTTAPAQRSGLPLGRRWLIKRVAATGGEPWPDGIDPAPWDRGEGRVPAGHIVLLSDNPRGVDSRRWGPCPDHQVMGRVTRSMGG